jgi:hypothetical protein
MSLLKSLFSSVDETPTFVKKIGDPLRVAISLEGSPTTPHQMVGCKVLFPNSVISPVLSTGNFVNFVDGEIYSTKQHDTICTFNTDRVTISKVLKSGEAAVADYGYLVILDFKCVGAGSGFVTLSDLTAAMLQDGEVHNYETETNVFDFVMTNPLPPVVNKILFKVVVEE